MFNFLIGISLSQNTPIRLEYSPYEDKIFDSNASNQQEIYEFTVLKGWSQGFNEIAPFCHPLRNSPLQISIGRYLQVDINQTQYSSVIRTFQDLRNRTQVIDAIVYKDKLIKVTNHDKVHSFDLEKNNTQGNFKELGIKGIELGNLIHLSGNDQTALLFSDQGIIEINLINLASKVVSANPIKEYFYSSQVPDTRMVLVIAQNKIHIYDIQSSSNISKKVPFQFDFQTELVDVEIQSKQRIYVLDRLSGVYILKMNSQGELTLTREMVELPGCENLYNIKSYLLANCRHSDLTNFIAEMTLDKGMWHVNRLTTDIRSISYLFADQKYVIAAGSIIDYFFRSDLGASLPEGSRNLGSYIMYKVKKVIGYKGRYIFIQPSYSLFLSIKLKQPKVICSFKQFTDGHPIRLTLTTKVLCASRICEYTQRVQLNPTRQSIIRGWMMITVTSIVLVLVGVALLFVVIGKLRMEKERNNYISFQEVGNPDDKGDGKEEEKQKGQKKEEFQLQDVQQ